MRYFSPEHQQVAASSPRQQLLTNQRALQCFSLLICGSCLWSQTGTHYRALGAQNSFCYMLSPPPPALPTVGGQGGYCYIASNRVLRTGPRTSTTAKTRYRCLMGSPHVPCLFSAEQSQPWLKNDGFHCSDKVGCFTCQAQSDVS